MKNILFAGLTVLTVGAVATVVVKKNKKKQEALASARKEEIEILLNEVSSNLNEDDFGYGIITESIKTTRENIANNKMLLANDYNYNLMKYSLISMLEVNKNS